MKIFHVWRAALYAYRDTESRTLRTEKFDMLIHKGKIEMKARDEKRRETREADSNDSRGNERMFVFDAD